MSAQRLGGKRLRFLRRETGEPIIRGWSHGGYVLGFVTTDHRHGFYDLKTGGWGWENTPAHYSSCEEFPDWPEIIALAGQNLRDRGVADTSGMGDGAQ